jgi:hypothetical protein
MTSCRLCDVPLFRTADQVSDEFTWTDLAGHRDGANTWLGADPHGRLADLKARLLAEPGDLVTAREYSALMTQVDFGGTIHEHRPHEVPAFSGTVPDHCGWPARLRPSGWQCRACGAGLGAVLQPAA